MKKIFSLLLLTGTFLCLKAQSVGINNTGAAPDSSAILDLRSGSKGLLLPRVFLSNTTDSITIKKPAISLLVFNTNTSLPSGAGFYAWSGAGWELILSTANLFSKYKDRHTTVVDGLTREYWVHIPPDYKDTVKTPVVFMLHGTSGDGERFYDESGWKELGDEQNIITVFPSSWKYHIIDSVPKFTTKWNTVPDCDWTYAPGETGKDDIKFLKKIILELRAAWNIDTGRIYLEGFSNGGQMAAKCSIEMSDIFAAIAQNAGSFYIDTVYIPKRKLPILYQVGNMDYGPGNVGPVIPLSHFEAMLNTPGTRNRNTARAHIRNFGLDSNYTVTGDTLSARIATFTGLGANPLNLYKQIYVDGLGHLYPNGQNHWMEAARYHWAWMRQFRLP